MKMKFAYLLLFMFQISILYAQISLNHSLNLPREGDLIVKQQIAYLDPGPKGTGILWNFSEQKLINDDYQLRFSAPHSGSDSIVGTEHRTMYHYQNLGDSLYLLGYENPTMFIRYRKPETLLVFPFPYGRAISDYFEAIGQYCNRFDISMQGKTLVSADATGMLILPGGDTLQHVLRVHTFKRIIERMTPVQEFNRTDDNSVSFLLSRDSIEHHLLHDSVYLKIDIWRWYAEGYRYPVFESVRNSLCRYDKDYEQFSASFYYPPHEQYYGLSDDSENQTKRDWLAGERWSSGKKGKTDKDADIVFNYYVDESSHLKLSFSLMNDFEVFISLYDLQGRQYYRQNMGLLQTGNYQKDIPLNGFPTGEYLLQLSIGGQIYGEKIVKE